MTRITFYVLPQHTVTDRHNFACRITEKAVSQGNNVMIATGDPAETDALDELLWTFRAEAFVPHRPAGSDCKAPVVISHHEDDAAQHDLLINLRSDIPSSFSRFNRLVEIVIQDETNKRYTRQHFTFYKERGYEIETHTI